MQLVRRTAPVVALLLGGAGCAPAEPPPRAPLVQETPAPFAVETKGRAELVPRPPLPAVAQAPTSPPGMVTGGVIGGTLRPVGRVAAARVRADGSRVYEFEPSMNWPKRVAGRELKRPPAGTKMPDLPFIHCVVEADGRLTECSVTHSSPAVEAEIVAVLSTWRMTPVLLNGSPVAVSYHFSPLPEGGGGLVGGTIGGTIGGPSSAAVLATDPGLTVVPFGAGMNRPQKISCRDVRYPPAARDAQIEGTMLVKCVIELDGKLTDCKVVKALPLMDVEVLAAISTWRMTPVLYNGQAIRVSYTIPVRLSLDPSKAPIGTIGGALAGPPSASPPAGTAWDNTPASETVLPFVSTMTAPARLAGRLPPARPGAKPGLARVRCVVGKDGTLLACRIDKSLDAATDAEILAALGTWSLKPATLDGRPVTCVYFFQFFFAPKELPMPRPGTTDIEVY
jgi:TonB family protein